MIKRILVALDLDMDTPIAIRHAIGLGEKFEASLTGLALVDTKSINLQVGGGGIGTIYYADMVRDKMITAALIEARGLLDKFQEMVAESKVKHTTHIDERGAFLERALLIAGKKAGLTRNSLLKKYPEIREDAFDADLKMMATWNQTDQQHIRVSVKGAPGRYSIAAAYIIVKAKSIQSHNQCVKI